jgi:hypothetical protein
MTHAPADHAVRDRVVRDFETTLLLEFVNERFRAVSSGLHAHPRLLIREGIRAGLPAFTPPRGFDLPGRLASRR